MKCTQPKLLYITVPSQVHGLVVKCGSVKWHGFDLESKNLVLRGGLEPSKTLYKVLVPCRHCYACECNSRAEWA